MNVQRKRAWRNFKKYKKNKFTLMLRHALCGVAALELLYGGFCLVRPVNVVVDSHSGWTASWEDEEKSSYGIQIDLKDGVFQIFKEKSYSQ